jgi:UDP:flavonoid glycosyltransferase YjiC (YdhE family)
MIGKINEQDINEFLSNIPNDKAIIYIHSISVEEKLY